ncbi:MAG: hypothetical protein GDA56_02985 [Hormoscilla sp. GM7CHS1pb]|nr:hypothetical protein [Hormoscilla sp. GM7CHS1pb]
MSAYYIIDWDFSEAIAYLLDQRSQALTLKGGATRTKSACAGLMIFWGWDR